MRIAIYAFCFLLLALQAGAQASDPAIVQGMVTEVGTGEPIVGATVTLTSISGRQGYTATTEKDGTFVVSNVAAGNYVTSVTKTGFVRPRAAVVAGATSRLNVAAGQRVQSLRLQLTPAATVSGRISDENGEPKSAVHMQLLQLGFLGPQRYLAPLPPGITTDERGEYRLSNIEPGEYYLAATPIQGKAGFVPTYYPGVPSLDRAAKLVVPRGELSAMDFSIFHGAVHSIRLKVQRPVSVPDNLPIRVTARMVNGGGYWGPITSDLDALGDDTYVIPHMAAGEYKIEVMWGPGYGPPNPSAMMNVDVRDKDVDLGTIPMPPVRSITGKIVVLEPSGTPTMPLKGFLLRRWDSVIVQKPIQVSDDGTFMDQIPEGRYRVFIPALPPESYVASVRYGAKDVYDTGLSIDGEPEGPIEIGISSGAATVEGIVRNAKDEATPGSRVVLLPAPGRRTNQDLIFQTAADQAGAFSIPKVPPGDYAIFATDVLPMDSWYDAEYMSSFEKLAVKITVDRASRKSVNLKMNPNAR